MIFFSKGTLIDFNVGVTAYSLLHSLVNLYTIRENEQQGGHFRKVTTRVLVPPAKMYTMQID